MAEKILNTRIQLKYDSLQAWNASEVALKAGEVAIAYLPPRTEGKDTEILPATAVLMKVGPGLFKDLPFVSALAADVHAWAKAANVSVVGDGNAITGAAVTDNVLTFTKGETFATKEELEDLREGLEADTNTNTEYRFEVVDGALKVYKTVYELGVAGEEAEVGTYDFINSDELADELAKYVTLEVYNEHLTAQGLIDAERDRRIKAIEDDYLKASEITEGATNGTIAVEGTDVKVHGLQDAAYATVASLNATAKGYADDVESKLGDLAVKDKITEGDIDGTIGVAKITNFATEVAAVKVAEATTADKVAHKFTVNGVEFDGSAEKSVTIDAASLGLESAMHFIGALSEAPATANAGDVYLNTATKKEYVYSDSQGWVELDDEGSHALKTIKIEGEGYLTGGGDLSADRKIDIAAEVKTKIDNGATAYGWGDHAQEGYLKADDIANKADKVTGATGGNFAGLDTNGNLIDSGKKAADFATAEQGAKADDSINDVYCNEDQAYDDSIQGALNISVNGHLGADGRAIGIDIAVKKGGIIAEALADKAVTAAKLADDAKALFDAAGTAQGLVDELANNQVKTNKEAIDAINHTETGILAQAKTEAATLDVVVLAESQKYTNEAMSGLHAIATSGSIYDIVEGHNISTGTDAGAKYIVFNCGSATTVI